jgi:hypothetical protein
MEVKELIAEFSEKTSLPIDLKEVEGAIRAKGVEDEIRYFHDVELDPNIFGGFLHTEEIPFEDDTRIIHTITYARMGEEMERLVCCKEMLHILDPDYLKSSTLKNVNQIIAEIILPADFPQLLNNGPHTNYDILSLWHAVAVLMPLACINLLRPALKEGKISIERIAEMAEVPLFAVGVAMNDAWPDFHAHLIRRHERQVM